MDLGRWQRLMAARGFAPNAETYAALESAWTGPGRHYHTAEHLDACLRHLDDGAEQVERPAEVELALWFHDAVYRPLASDNEERSADWAASFSTANGASRDATERLRRLVLVTRDHGATRTHDEAVLVDVDLAILGATPEAYDCFERQVRAEYRLVPSFLYRRKRAEVLRGFLERPRIYTSGIFGAERERRARANLERAIRHHAGRGS